MIDEISVDTPYDIPEKVLLLFSRIWRSGFLLLKVDIA